MIVQFGEAPPKGLSENDRAQIASLLKKPPGDLTDLFQALDTIITAGSLEAQPLVDPERRDRARTDLDNLRKHADALQTAIGAADQQIILRLVSGSLRVGPNGEAPLGDFSKHLLRFRNQLKDIDEALTPRRGGGNQADHLRSIVARCAIQYWETVGEEPAKRRGGIFHRMMNIVLAAIDLKLPQDPYNILSPAIDVAKDHHNTL
jgi:hypothetical protein